MEEVDQNFVSLLQSLFLESSPDQEDITIDQFKELATQQLLPILDGVGEDDLPALVEIVDKDNTGQISLSSFVTGLYKLYECHPRPVFVFEFISLIFNISKQDFKKFL